MARARPLLSGFLQQAKQALRVAQAERLPVTLVIGNQSADLDSIACAIVYSYLRSTRPGPAQKLHIPIIHIPRADVSLRTELLPLLERVDIEQDSLVTLDDLGDLASIETRLTPKDTRWILVDHNRLEGELTSTYSKHVVGAVDHHVDEHAVPEDTGDEPRIITTAGSCSSLVANYCRQDLDSATDATVAGDIADKPLWSSQVAQLALAAILIDTTALQDEHKTTSHDREAVDFLESKLDSKLGYDRKVYWQTIQSAKEDLDPLPVYDILRKDYKTWTDGGLTLGTAAVVRSIGFLKGKANAEEDDGDLAAKCIAYAKEKDLDLLAVMTAFSGHGEGDAFQRELLLLCPQGKRGAVAAAERFCKDSSQELELKKAESGEVHGWSWAHYKQGNVGASRKQVAPLLRKAMASSGKPTSGSL